MSVHSTIYSQRADAAVIRPAQTPRSTVNVVVPRSTAHGLKIAKLYRPSCKIRVPFRTT